MSLNRYFFLVGLCLLWAASLVQAQEQTPTIELLSETVTLTGRVTGMALSRDSARLAVADDSNTFTVLSLESNTALSQFAIGNGDLFLENSVHYSADGTLIVVGTFYSVRVVDGLTGIQRYEIAGGVDDLALAPDGQRLYVLNADVVTVYDTASGSPVNSFSVGAADDGRAASDLEVLADGTLVLLVPDASFDYYVTTFSPDGVLLTSTESYGRDLIAAGQTAISAYYGSLFAYRSQTAETFLLSASAPCGDFAALAVNPDASLLAAVAADCGLHIFDVSSGAEVFVESLTDAGKVAFNNERLIVSAGTALRVYAAAAPGASADSAEESQASAATTVDAQTNAEETIPPAAEYVYRFNFSTRLGPDGMGIAGVAISPEGDKVAGIAGFDPLIIAYRTADYGEIGRYEGSAGSINIAYSADGRYLVAIDSNDQFLIFDAATMNLLSQAQLPVVFAEGLVASSSAAYFFSQGNGESMLYKVDLAAATLTGEVIAFPSIQMPSYLALLPDETIIGAGMTNDGTQLKIWDADLNELVAFQPDYWEIEYADGAFVYMLPRFVEGVMVYGYFRADSLESSPVLVGDDECLLVEFATAADLSFSVGTRFRCAMTLFNLQTGQVDDRIAGDTAGSDLVLSPDSRTLYVATRQGIEVYTISATPR